MPSFNPEEVVQAAVSAVAKRAGPGRESFDDFPGALYVTDTEGLITDPKNIGRALAGETGTRIRRA